MTAAPFVVLHWLAFAFAAVAEIVAIAAASARAYFVMVMFLTLAVLLVSLALLTLGAGQAALAMLLAGAGATPFLFLGGVLLSSRAIRRRQSAAPWLLMAAAVGATAVMVWATQDLAFTPLPLPAPIGLGAWLAPLLLVAGVVCLGLLGYGERGGLERQSGGRDS